MYVNIDYVCITDVKTEASYQKYMDKHFFGLIFACFDNDKNTKVIK